MDKIKSFLDEATSELKGDSEIQREVALELESHIHSSIEEGSNESTSESEDRALAELGSASLISDSLFEANKHRIKFRALIDKSVKAFLLPTLLVFLVWQIVANSFFTTGSNQNLELLVNNEWPEVGEGQDHTVNAREQWQKEPTGLHFANLVQHVDKITPLELATAEKLFPDNAWIKFCELELAIEGLEDIPREYTDELKQETLTIDCTTRLINDPRFQSGIEKFLGASVMKRYDSYIQAQLDSSLTQNASSLSTVNYVKGIAVAYTLTSNPQIELLKLNKIIAGGVKYELFSKGQVRPLILAQVKNAYHLSTEPTLVGQLVAIELLESISNYPSSVFTENFTESEVESMQSNIISLATAIRSRRDMLQNNTDSEQIPEVVEMLSIATNRHGVAPFCQYHPSFQGLDKSSQQELKSYISSDPLRPTRLLIYAAAERHMIQIFALLIALLIPVHFVGYRRQRKRSGHPHLKLKFTARIYLKGLGVCVCLPTLLYALVFKLPLTGARIWGMHYHHSIHYLEIATLLVSIIVLTVLFFTSQLRQRCLALDLPFGGLPRWFSRTQLAILIVSWLWIIVLPRELMTREDLNESLAIASYSLLAMIALLPLIGMVFQWRATKSHTVKMLRHQMFAPTFGLLLLSFSFVSQLSLHLEEKHWLSILHDPAEGYGGFPNKDEVKTTKSLQKRLQKAISTTLSDLGE